MQLVTCFVVQQPGRIQDQFPQRMREMGGADAGIKFSRPFGIAVIAIAGMARSYDARLSFVVFPACGDAGCRESKNEPSMAFGRNPT